MTQNSHCIQEILLKIGILKEDYQKALKKLILFFLSNPVPFNGQRYQKQKRPGTSDQSLSRIQNKFRKIPLLVISDQIWLCKSGFWVIPKIVSANLCKPIHGIINYSTSIWPFESGKCGKGFLDEIKNIFHRFWRAIIW